MIDMVVLLRSYHFLSNFLIKFSIFNQKNKILIQNFVKLSVCFDMAWDTDGDLLALICERTSTVYLWDANNHKLSQIDSQFK